MDKQKGDIPIVTYEIPRIEIYQVTDNKLKRIEDETSRVAQNFAFMLTSKSIFFSFLIALGTDTFDATMEFFS